MLKKIMLGFIALFAILTTLSTVAMLPPGAYEEAREKANYHVQVLIEKLGEPDQNNECLINGKVAKIIRVQDGSIELDQAVSFPVSCLTDDTPRILGPALWLSLEKLKQAKMLDVYLMDTHNHPSGATHVVSGWQVEIIE